MAEKQAAAWELASEALAEAARCGVAPSLERLGRLGQLGSLAALVEALGDEEALAGAAIAHAREREGVGVAPSASSSPTISSSTACGRSARRWTGACCSSSSA